MNNWIDRRWIPIFLLFFLLLNASVNVTAAEENTQELGQIRKQTEEKILEELNFSEIDDSLKKLFPDQKISFREVLNAMISGNLEETGSLLIQYLKDQFTYEFHNNRRNLVYMLLIAIVAAIFTNFSSALQNRQVSEISFYVLYMLLITMCLTSFKVAMTGMESRSFTLRIVSQSATPV